MSTTRVATAKTAAVCVIGDEILSGKTRDTNTPFLARQLFDIGVDLRRVEVIPDDEADIIETVQRMSRTYSYVFTSGGIGPTHDDITYASIAKAFDDELVVHPPTLLKMAEHSPTMVTVTSPPTEDADLTAGMIRESDGAYLTTTTAARLRMAKLPSRASAAYTPGMWVPICIANDNVHILPGIPRLFEAMVSHYMPTLAADAGIPFLRRAVGTMLKEGDISDQLTVIQDRYKDAGIKVGSYPHFGVATVGPERKRERVTVTVTGRDHALVEQATEEIVLAIQGFRHHHAQL
ncbi:putative molybdopterin binding domain-containing protein [Blastocladiella britannica]|nr:putative molybdopterin binding domain-containing protein [Blastocladiella britannica]